MGLSFALLAVSLTVITGNPIYDAIGSIVIGALLLIIAVLIGVEIKALIIGQGVEPRKLTEMREFLERQPEIAGILNLLTLQLGNDVMVAIKAHMYSQGSEEKLIEAINDCEKRLKSTFPEIVWCFFEPDITD